MVELSLGSATGSARHLFRLQHLALQQSLVLHDSKEENKARRLRRSFRVAVSTYAQRNAFYSWRGSGTRSAELDFERPKRQKAMIFLKDG